MTDTQTTELPDSDESQARTGLFPPETRRRALIGALLAGIGGLLLVNRIVELQNLAGDVEYVDVIAAARDLEPGTRLEAGDLQVRSIPAEFVHNKSVRSADAGLIVGKALANGIAAKEPVLWNSLARDDQIDAGLSSMVRPGERAVAIPVDGISSVGYMVRPGDRVDLFIVARRGGSRSVVPILQNVTVLGTGDVLAGQGSASEYGRIIASLTPREAEMVLLAQQLGRIYLLLRNGDDSAAETEFPVLSEFELLGGDVRKNIQKQRNDRQVKIIKGSG